MRSGGFETPFQLHAIDCVEGLQDAQEASHIIDVARVNYIHIERVHGSAVQDGRKSTDQDKLDAAFMQGAQARN
jgi:hypothetical protein